MRRKSGVFCKRGETVFTLVKVVIALLVFSLIGFFGLKIFNDMNTDIQADSDLSSDAKTVVGDLQGRYNSVMDGLFIFALVLFWMLLVVAAFFTDSHPIFFVFTLIIMVFVLYIGGVLGNAYETVVADDDISSLIPSFPMTNFVMSNFVPFIIVMIFSVLIAWYGKASWVG